MKKSMCYSCGYITFIKKGRCSNCNSPKEEVKIEKKGYLINLKILCPYCSKPYSARMELDYDTICYSEETGCDTTVNCKIYCDNCGKLVYTKGN